MRDADACFARGTGWGVRRQREGRAVLQRAERASERGSTAAVLPPSACAGAPHHAHAETPDGVCQDLGVAVARHDDGDVGVRLRPDRRHHHELPMPHGEDLRMLGEELALGVRRVAQHAARANDEADVELGERTSERSDDVRMVKHPQRRRHASSVFRYALSTRAGARTPALSGVRGLQPIRVTSRS